MLDAVTMIGAGRILQGGRIGLQRIVDARIPVGVNADLPAVLMRAFHRCGQVFQRIVQLAARGGIQIRLAHIAGARLI